MKRFVFKKPSNRTQSNRTRNQSNTRRNQSNRRTRSNRRRGSNRTATQSSRNVTEVANRQRQIRQHLNNRFRNPKKAVLLITTHGNLDDTDERVQHALDINVHKLNATTPGVCNWIADEDLVGMGLKINEIVNDFNLQERTGLAFCQYLYNIEKPNISLMQVVRNYSFTYTDGFNIKHLVTFGHI